MVLCATCRVNTIDRHCTNTPRSCYQCCTSHVDILTCPSHYQQMGIPDAAARLATGRVHPIIAEDAEASLQSGDAQQQPPAPPGGELAQADGALSSPPSHPQPASDSVNLAPAAPVPSIAAPPVASQGALAASMVNAAVSEVAIAELRASMAAELRASMAAMQKSLATAIASAVQSSFVAVLSSQASAQAAPTAPTAVAPQQAVTPPPPSASPPHRAAVLDGAATSTSRAEIANLVSRFSALSDDDDADDGTHQVQQHTHTRREQPLPAALLPTPFVPTAAGTEQSAQQQLVAIVNGLNKQGSKVKYTTIAELDEALDDWATDSIKTGWSAKQVQSIRAYQHLLVANLTVSQRRPLKQVLDYHRRWCKAVHEGDIDMFAKGAELNHAILYDVDHPRQYGPTSATNPSTSKAGKDTATAAKAGTTGGHPAAGKHLAGSCTNHPNSTTHTTAECKKK